MADKIEGAAHRQKNRLPWDVQNVLGWALMLHPALRKSSDNELRLSVSRDEDVNSQMKDLRVYL